MNRRLNRHSLAADAILRATEIFTNFHPLNRDYDNNKLKFSIVELMEILTLIYNRGVKWQKTHPPFMFKLDYDTVEELLKQERNNRDVNTTCIIDLVTDVSNVSSSFYKVDSKIDLWQPELYSSLFYLNALCELSFDKTKEELGYTGKSYTMTGV